MPNPNFPGPNLNRVIDADPQIIRVPLDHAEFGARKSAQPKKVNNEMTLSHVKSK
jgi:hypothetical protein